MAISSAFGLEYMYNTLIYTSVTCAPTASKLIYCLQANSLYSTHEELVRRKQVLV